MTGKTLSQVDTIKALGDALTWFQRELAWGAQPSSLVHLTGRIGELFAAVTVNGEMATAVNQRGYDIMTRDTNRRVSVKTITTSSHVTFNANTFDLVDDVLILKIEVDGDEVSIRTVLSSTADEAKAHCTRDGGGNYTYVVRSRAAPIRPPEAVDIRDQIQFGKWLIKQYVNGTVQIEQNGTLVPSAISALREIGEEIDPRLLLNSSGNPRNTRQLGAAIIDTLKALADNPTSVA